MLSKDMYTDWCSGSQWRESIKKSKESTALKADKMLKTGNGPLDLAIRKSSVTLARPGG